MERPHTRRNRAETSTLTGGDSEGPSDVNEKKHKRHYTSFRHCVQRSRTQRSRFRLFLITFGVFCIIQMTRNMDVNFSFRRADSPSDNDFPLVSAPLVIPRVSGYDVMKQASFLFRPRVFGFYFTHVDSESFFGVERLDSLHRPRMTHHKVYISPRAVREQLHLKDSRDYNHGRRDEWETGDCKAQHEWQLGSFPTCNALHEHDLSLVGTGAVKLLGNGYWRDVWRVLDGEGKKQVLKTIRYEHDYEDRNYDRHRRDALAMERLTKSDNIIDIFAFCGNSGMNEYAPGGDLEDMIWDSDEKWNSTEKLIVAYQVASGVSDVHNVEGNGRTSIAHTDITTSQFVFSDGRYKLNDFNRCRFIAWNEKKNRPCKFNVGNNPGNFRSPEEYNYEPESEKIDVYSMGNVFYTLLTETWPFDNDRSEDAQRRVMAGKRPHISSRFRDSNDPAIRAMLMAITMSWRQDPEERATSIEVKEFLHEQLKALKVPSDDE